jgi:hypothetical protein
MARARCSAVSRRAKAEMRPSDATEGTEGALTPPLANTLPHFGLHRTGWGKVDQPDGLATLQLIVAHLMDVLVL